MSIDSAESYQALIQKFSLIDKSPASSSPDDQAEIIDRIFAIFRKHPDRKLLVEHAPWLVSKDVTRTMQVSLGQFTYDSGANDLPASHISHSFERERQGRNYNRAGSRYAQATDCGKSNRWYIISRISGHTAPQPSQLFTIFYRNVLMSFFLGP